MKTMLLSNGQFVLPAELRARDKICPGQQFKVERVRDGEYLLKKLPSSVQLGLVAWLQSCPDNDWFQEISSESTDER